MTRTIYVVHLTDDAGGEAMIGACSTLAGAKALVARDVPGPDLAWRQDPPRVDQELERHVVNVPGGQYSIGRWSVE